MLNSLKPAAVGAVLASVALALPAAVVAAPVVRAQATGQVVRIDAVAGKIAIRHGAIAALSLPAMTLFYHIDRRLLAGLAVGDRVTFTAERVDAEYRIVAISK